MINHRLFRTIHLIALLTLLVTGACGGKPSRSNPAAPQVSQATLAPTLPPDPASSRPAPATPQAAKPDQKETRQETKEAKQETKSPLPAAAAPKDRPTVPAAPASSSDFIAIEILGRPTNTSITVNVVPAKAMEIYYEYGTAAGTYPGQTPPQQVAAGMPVETTLTGLQPDTRYTYRIRYRTNAGEFLAGQEHTFSTQRAPGSTFTFAIQGDSHPERLKSMFDPALYTRTLLSASSARPDFYLTIGDDFSVDTLKTITADAVTQIYKNQRPYLGLVGSSAPVFLVNGNHEQAALANLNGTPNNVAVWAQNTRNLYYPQPAPDSFYTGNTQPVDYIGLLRNYYAWTWGDALFVVIDPYWHSKVVVDNAVDGSKKNRNLWDITLGDAQYQWFKQTLEQSKARYKFVFTHHVSGTGRGGIELAGLYEWGGKDPNGNDLFAKNRPGWSQPIHQLMAANHVTIFFQGHDHIFVRQQLDGVIYQSLPVPADPNYAFDNADAYRTGDKLPNSGHVRVTVSPNGVTVDYIRSYLGRSDEKAFTYTVP